MVPRNVTLLCCFPTSALPPWALLQQHGMVRSAVWDLTGVQCKHSQAKPDTIK